MASNRISFDQAVSSLLSGGTLTWPKHDKYAKGSITLQSVEERRLFAQLLKCSADQVVEAHDDVFAAILTAWENKDDPAEDVPTVAVPSGDIESWRLDQIQTEGFGGLNTHDGPPFELPVDQKTWCLDGQNGSGKTSLISAVMWALTGKRIREHSGVIEDKGERQPVLNPAGEEIGTWPPLIAYPSSKEELVQTAKVSVKLTFINAKGDEAIACRSIQSPMAGSPTSEENIDLRLLTAPQLFETGILMPALLSQLGFGDKSQTLYEAVKTLTRLDQLAAISEGATSISRGGSRFLNYGKRAGLDGTKRDFTTCIDKAKDLSQDTQYDLSEFENIDQKNLATRIEAKAKSADHQAGERAKSLATEISKDIKPEDETGRKRIGDAIARAKQLIEEGPEKLDTFAAYEVLTGAGAKGELKDAPSALDKIEDDLRDALKWHARQDIDEKLRLKALGAEWFVIPEDDTETGECPLCDGDLLSDEQKAIALVLIELKENAQAAQRRLEDVCANLETEISNVFPESIRRVNHLLLNQGPAEVLRGELLSRFASTSPFSAVLTGAAGLVLTATQETWKAVPAFEWGEANVTSNEAAAKSILDHIAQARHILRLSDWWTKNKTIFSENWNAVIGRRTEDDTWPISKLGEHLKDIEDALTSAKPFSETARALEEAARKAAKWETDKTEQRKRDAIAKALKPLKDLGVFVNAETARSINRLSGRIENVLERIHLSERLEFHDTKLERKSHKKSDVKAHGSFAEGMIIDAGLVANTSWLRAILWGFIFALREEIIEDLGANPFPLIALDDPQVTFDPRNEGLWAKELTRLAKETGADQAQILLTTHETNFFKELVTTYGLTEEHGRIVGINPETGCVTIDQESHLDALFAKAKRNKDDKVARQFISELRPYLENCLRYLLCGQGKTVRGELLSHLIVRLGNLCDDSSPPFNHSSFSGVLNTLSSNPALVKKVQEEHHIHKYGLPDAEEIHADLWLKVKRNLHDAFYVMADWRTHKSNPNTYVYDNNIVQFPSGHDADIRKIRLHNTHIAVAARTDGRTGDGLVELRELDDAQEVFLEHHEIYQLKAQTLEPVVNVGDYIIVRMHGPIGQSNLVVAGHNGNLLARRYAVPDTHPRTAVLSAQAVDPKGIARPILVPTNEGMFRKIVGTLFNPKNDLPPIDSNEVVQVDDPAQYMGLLDGMRLFGVEGQSALPIAMETQYLITGHELKSQQDMLSMNSRLVIAVDGDGAKYFKRFRLAEGSLIVLESLNPDGQNAALIASFDGSVGVKLDHLRPVNGVLFELPTTV